MPYDQQGLKRHSLRLSHYDYSQPGWYFVTICTHEKRKMFGEVADGKVCLNASGELVQKIWNTLPDRFSSVQLDEFIIMPNHVHGILVLAGPQSPSSSIMSNPGVANVPAQPQSYMEAKNGNRPTLRPRLGEVIRTFKGAATYLIRSTVSPAFAWQSHYHDHIIRDQDDLDRIRLYIIDNPTRWSRSSTP